MAAGWLLREREPRGGGHGILSFAYARTSPPRAARTVPHQRTEPACRGGGICEGNGWRKKVFFRRDGRSHTGGVEMGLERAMALCCCLASRSGAEARRARLGPPSSRRAPCLPCTEHGAFSLGCRSDEEEVGGGKYRRMDEDGLHDKERFAR